MSNSEALTRGFGRVEVRKADDGTPRMIAGYASVFNERYDIGGWFTEVVEPGAFKRAIEGQDIFAVVQHSMHARDILGRTKSGTLRLKEDERGLSVEIDPPDTTTARDLLVSMDRGDVGEMSFAFTMEGGSETWDDTGEIPLRTIHEFGEIREVTITPQGANPATTCSARAKDELDSRKKPDAETNHKNAAERLKRKAKHDHALRGVR